MRSIEEIESDIENCKKLNWQKEVEKYEDELRATITKNIPIDELKQICQAREDGQLSMNGSQQDPLSQYCNFVKEKQPDNIDWKAFISGTLIVDCQNQTNALEFLRECESRYPNMRWLNGSWPTHYVPDCYFRIRISDGCLVHGAYKYGGYKVVFYDSPSSDYNVTHSPCREVKRHALTGEWIKIVRTLGSRISYSVGNIYRVLEEYDGDIVINNSEENYVDYDEYVVLEGYDPLEIYKPF